MYHNFSLLSFTAKSFIVKVSLDLLRGHHIVSLEDPETFASNFQHERRILE